VSLAALIRKRDTAKPANDNSAKAANDGLAGGRSLAGLAPLALANSPEAKADTPDPETETRRQRVLTMLADNPALRLAVVCDGAGDPVKLAVAIREKGSVEVLIPAARFDPFALLALMDKHTASETLH
jgi:hypothetical protein